MSLDADALAPASVLEVRFDLQGQALPRAHRRALSAALQQVLPWLWTTPGTSMLPLKLPPGDGAALPLSRRTRLTLRVPRLLALAAQGLDGATLEVAGQRLVPQRPRLRELLAAGTLYAPLVVFDLDDEAAFLQQAQTALGAIGVTGRAICGRRQSVEDGSLVGYSLMLDGLGPADALCLQERGLGRYRELGCGVFVPHKSAAAVGAPL